MQRSMFKMLTTSLSAAAMVGASVAAFAGGVSVNLASGQKIFSEGKGDVPACNSCHGIDGMGDDAMGTPRLAGQVYQFLVKQLEDFATDKRQDTTMFVMNANAKGLSVQDRMDVSAYANSLAVNTEKLSNLSELSANGTEVGQTHIGKAIVNYGILDKDVPACASCHGYNGRGVDPIYPEINRQKYTYIVNQLKKWRDGSRANDPLEQMQKVARKLSDDDIMNAAAYLSGASPLTMGNTGEPIEHKPFDYKPFDH